LANVKVVFQSTLLLRRAGYILETIKYQSSPQTARVTQQYSLCSFEMKDPDAVTEEDNLKNIRANIET
jgi:hypothetical protein